MRPKRDAGPNHRLLIKAGPVHMRVSSQSAVLVASVTMAVLLLAGALAWAGIG